MNNHVHNSLTNHYIQDYIKLTHELYPSFFTKVNATYYSLNIEASTFDPEYKDMYKQADSIEHGGRYDAIYNIPLYIVTNNALTENAGEKGITTKESTDINCIIDPLVNIIPKDRDMLSFKLGLDNDIVYGITNLELSSTMKRPFTKISIQAIPTLTSEKMKHFIISQNAFIDEYHKIFEQKEVFTILQLQKIVKDYVNYFNEIYDHQMDAHIDSNSKVFLEFEKAFNYMIDYYKLHLGIINVDRSYLADNLLNYYNDDNPFQRMLFSNTGNFLDYKITTSIKRLEKTRRRSINNRVKVYRLLDLSNKTDSLINETYINYVNDLQLPISIISTWDEVVKAPFLTNKKNQMEKFIKESCIVNPDDMFENAIRLAQLLYILDNITKKQLSTTLTNITPLTNISV